MTYSALSIMLSRAKKFADDKR